MPKKGYKPTKEHRLHVGLVQIGRRASQETREKMSRAQKIAQNKSERKKQQRLSRLGKHHTQETKEKISISHRGSKSYLWKGGISSSRQILLHSMKYRYWRQQIFIRDDFTCQKCGIKGTYLEAHHLKSFSNLTQEARNYMPLLTPYDAAMLYTPLWDISNGITLCKKCHNKTKFFISNKKETKNGK